MEKIEDLDILINELHVVYGPDAGINFTIIGNDPVFYINSKRYNICDKVLSNISYDDINKLVLAFNVEYLLKNLLKISSNLSDEAKLKIELM